MLSDQVFVVWPPVWNAYDPHIAIPALTGYLKNHGIAASAFDLNIEFFRYVIAEETVNELISRFSPGDSEEYIARAIEFVRRYYSVLHSAELEGSPANCFSEDAEKVLLSKALAIFNGCNPSAFVTADGLYYKDSDNSEALISLAEKDVSNIFVPFLNRNFIPTVASKLPSIIGISVSGPFQLLAAFTLARKIKEFEARILVVVGGAFFSTIPEVFWKPGTRSNLFRYVDAFVFNEGELPFLNIIRQKLKGGEISFSPNVLLPNDLRPHSEVLDPRLCVTPNEIAMPGKESIPLRSYFRPIRRMPIEVSRGCYWGKCTFCNLADGANRKYRPLPLEKIIGQIESLQETGTAPLSVQFSTLAMAPALLRKLAKEILRRGLRVYWNAWIRPEIEFVESDIELAKMAGCVSLAITPESFSARTLTLMNKGFDSAHLVRIVRDLKRYELCHPINLIPGFPGETENDFLSTMEVCHELELKGELFPFRLLKGSHVYRNPGLYGIEVIEDTSKDLAIAVSFERRAKTARDDAISMIHSAAKRFPRQISVQDPFNGYTFDFSQDYSNS